MCSWLDSDHQFPSENNIKENVRYKYGNKLSTPKICGYYIQTESEMMEHDNHYHSRTFEWLKCVNKFDRKGQLKRYMECHPYETIHTIFDRRYNHIRSEVICYDYGNLFYNMHDMMIEK